MIFNGMFFSRATVSSCWRPVVLPTPGIPATMMVRDNFPGSLSEESFDSRVYFGNSLFDQYLVVLFDDAYCQEYSCSGAEGPEEVGACRDGADNDSSDNGDGRDVAVEDLSYGGAGASESFYLHSRVD